MRKKQKVAYVLRRPDHGPSQYADPPFQSPFCSSSRSHFSKKRSCFYEHCHFELRSIRQRPPHTLFEPRFPIPRSSHKHCIHFPNPRALASSVKLVTPIATFLRRLTSRFQCGRVQRASSFLNRFHGAPSHSLSASTSARSYDRGRANGRVSAIIRPSL